MSTQRIIKFASQEERDTQSCVTRSCSHPVVAFEEKQTKLGKTRKIFFCALCVGVNYNLIRR